MAALVGQHGRSPQHDFGHMHIRNGVDTITRWDGNPSWNSGRMQLGGSAVLVSKHLPSTIYCPSVANHRLDFRQTSSLADGTQSLFPFAAERPTSHSSRTWLVCKTQLLLPWLNPSSYLSFYHLQDSPPTSMSLPFPSALTADGSVNLNFLRRTLHTAHDRIHMLLLPQFQYKIGLSDRGFGCSGLSDCQTNVLRMSRTQGSVSCVLSVQRIDAVGNGPDVWGTRPREWHGRAEWHHF